MTNDTFDQLAASRRAWLDDVLIPWCRRASRAELLKAEPEWQNLAGRVDPESTLWAWAWSRFPDLTDDAIAGLNETCEVEVRLNDGSRAAGYPDARASGRGELVLTGDVGESGPFSIDEIAAIERVSDGCE